MFLQETWFDSWSTPCKSEYLCRWACSGDTLAPSFSLLSPSPELHQLVGTASLCTSASSLSISVICKNSDLDLNFPFLSFTWIMSQVERQEAISSEAIKPSVFEGDQLWWWCSKLPLVWSWCFIPDTTE